MHIMSTNVTKTLFGNMNMTSNCDVINSTHQMQMTNICHWMKRPMTIFCVRCRLHWLLYWKVWFSGVSQIRRDCTLRLFKCSALIVTSDTSLLSCVAYHVIKVTELVWLSLIQPFCGLIIFIRRAPRRPGESFLIFRVRRTKVNSVQFYSLNEQR